MLLSMFKSNRRSFLYFYLIETVVSISVSLAPIGAGALLKYIETGNKNALFLSLTITLCTILSGAYKIYIRPKIFYKFRGDVFIKETRERPDQTVDKTVARYQQTGNLRVFFSLDIPDIIYNIILMVVSLVTVIFYGLLPTVIGLLILLIGFMVSVIQHKKLKELNTIDHDLQDKLVKVMLSDRPVMYRSIHP